MALWQLYSLAHALLVHVQKMTDDKRRQLSWLLESLKQNGWPRDTVLDPDHAGTAAAYIFSLSWRQRCHMMRDIALALAQSHAGDLDPMRSPEGTAAAPRVPIGRQAPEDAITGVCSRCL